MGMDCNAKLPDNVRVDYVSMAIGISVGCPLEWKIMDNGGKIWRYFDVTGVELRSAKHSVHVCMINIKVGKVCDKCKCINVAEGYSFMYHFEGSHGGRTVSLNRSRAKNLAIGMKLIEFFGGELEYNDHNDDTIKVAAKSDLLNRPTDGQPWQDMYDRLAAILPITQADLDSARTLAAYKED